MGDWFIINDLDDFTDRARAIVYNNFGLWNKDSDIDILIDSVAEKNKDEFDRILTHQESLIIVKNIVKKQKHKKKQTIRYILNEKLFASIVEDLNSRMVSNILNSLVQKDLIETAFDTETNDFIFWVKEKNKDQPETD